MTQLRRLAALAAAPLLVVGLAPAASADSHVHSDARGDVVEFTFDEQTGEETVTPAPEVAEGDITRTVISHGKRRLVATMRFAELSRTRGIAGYVVQLDTDEGLRRDATVFATADQQRGEAELTGRRGMPVDCAGLRHRIDRERDVVRVSVPRACLRDPRWIRAGVGAFQVDGNVAGSVHGDDGFRNAEVRNRLAWSPRLRRG